MQILLVQLVGQDTVTGEISKISGEKYTIDGTTYKLSKNEVEGVAEGPGTTPAAKDKVELSLDAYGYVYKIEADATNRLYAAVLKVGSTEDDFGGDATYTVKMLTAAGETLVANVDEDYDGYEAAITDAVGKTKGSVTAPTIVKYHLNSSNEIDFIEGVTATSNNAKKKVSSAGYYNGYAMASNVAIFSVTGNDPADADNYSIVKYEDAIGKEFVASYATNSDDKIVMMLADDLVAQDVIFGMVTGSGTNSSDAGAYVEVLTKDGETTSYNCSPSVKDQILTAAGTNKENLIGFKVSSDNEIKSGKFEAVATKADFLGGDDVQKASGAVVKIENSRITIGTASYAYTSDVVVFDNDNDDNKYTADGSTSDIEAGYTVAMYDIDGEDGVYDIIVITARK